MGRFKANSPPIAQGRALHSLYFTCVHPDFREQGIVRNLWDESIKIARNNNYQMMVAEAAHGSVSKILDEHLGFEEVAQVDFQTFKFEGQTPFSDLDENNRLCIYSRKITSDLFV